MDYPIFPFEILKHIGEFIPDSRGLYLTCSRLYNSALDREYWESRGNERIRLHPVKLPTVLPMWNFSYNGNLPMVRKFFEEDKYYTRDLAVQLNDAAYNGHFDIVKYLHGERAVPIELLCTQAITSAATNGHLNMVIYLHERGASVDSAFNQPIKMAAKHEHLEVVKYLHHHGAKLPLFDFKSIQKSNMGRHKYIVNYLSENGYITA